MELEKQLFGLMREEHKADSREMLKDAVKSLVRFEAVCVGIPLATFAGIYYAVESIKYLTG